MEDTLVQAREQDYSLVQSAVLEATVEFEKSCGMQIKLSIDKENPLPAERYLWILI